MFTPDPWRVRQDADGDSVIESLNSEEATALAVVRRPSDAALIAVAPEMYELLGDILDSVEAPNITKRCERLRRRALGYPV